MDSSQTNNDRLIGSTFAGKYLITKKLGQGGMGSVYLAEHSMMKRRVAIKLLRPELLSDEIQRKRFEREARMASQLSHPNAVILHDFGIVEDAPYLVMEYIEGRTLKEIIKAEAPLSLERIRGIFKQMCSGLGQAHKLGIVHRDIKPDNFLLGMRDDGSEWLKVLDFGVAKAIGPARGGPDANLTQLGAIIGTPQYMAPEQCMEQEVDARTDIYGLGVVLYQMISGRAPFEGGSSLELMTRIMTEPVCPLTKIDLKLNVPTPVDNVVQKALRKEPQKRFDSMEEFWSAFEAAAPSPLSKKGKFGALSGVAVCLILLGAGYLLYLGPVDSGGSHSGVIQLERETKAAAEKARKAEEERRKALKEAEAFKAEAERQAEAHKRERAEREEALRRQQEAQRLAEEKVKQVLIEAEAVKAESARLLEEAEEAKRQKQLAVEQLEESRKAEQERAEKAAKKSKIVVKSPEAERKSAAALKKAALEKEEAAKRVAAMKEKLRREAAAAAKARAELERLRVEQKAEQEKLEVTEPSAQETADPVKKQKRRRCGPRWCR